MTECAMFYTPIYNWMMNSKSSRVCDKNKNCIGELISNVRFFFLCVRVKISAYQSSTKKRQSCNELDFTYEYLPF